MRKQSGMFILSVLIGLAVLSGCGNGSNSGNGINGAGDGGTGMDKSAAEQKHDPITLTFGTNQGGYNEEVFNTYVKKPIEAKFPYITMNYVDTKNGGDLEKLIAAGETPDILNSGGRGLARLKDLQLVEDLNPYIKKFNLNLSNLNQAGVESVKTYSEGGRMLALPYLINFYVMLYNQDIFDKFAVPYPKDNMTWDEAKQLAERVTRQADGTQFRQIEDQANKNIQAAMEQ
jgi:multiple sugar transport system substrate-binding protein